MLPRSPPDLLLDGRSPLLPLLLAEPGVLEAFITPVRSVFLNLRFLFPLPLPFLLLDLVLPALPFPFFLDDFLDAFLECLQSDS